MLTISNFNMLGKEDTYGIIFEICNKFSIFFFVIEYIKKL